MENVKLISEKEFKAMGGKVQEAPQVFFELVGIQKRFSRNGKEWALPVFEKKMTRRLFMR